ncbi:uncharacterized protein TA21375 [Theileria annulata]|uniref:Uncharacterized protein n=1 Tax=Theileria annulata TaxID=5874 RepID=Q4UGN2_THEAN|nr:uncharacterized protein TA21375 [Theileria annulata]CAI73757.1 hypothetical protein TA21375 [Theileria annulata]|eukprot:XP_954434.1 hypothetical protein TA21375 [Theileria annulata]
MEKKGAIKIPAGKNAEKIADEIKNTAQDPADTNYYQVIDRKTKITYFFKLDTLQAKQLTTGTPITAPVTIGYGHIFAEGFSGTEAKPSMISTLLIVLVEVITYHDGAVSYPGNLKPENLSAINITKITITDNKGTKTIYNRVEEGDTPSITIKTDGGEADGKPANFKQAEGTPTGKGTKNTITLTTTDRKTISITGTTTPATVPFGHILTETLDTNAVRWEIVSPTLMVIVGIMKSQRIYDPYVWMGNWGGSHKEVTADGDITLTSNTNGSYSNSGGTYTITLNISKAAYKTGTATTEAQSLTLGSDTNTLVLTSGGDITGGGTHNLTRDSLTLTLSKEDSNFTSGTYNVSLNITQDITLSGSTCSDCKLKRTTDTGGKHTPYSLGTYNITSSGTTTYTGDPDPNDMHEQHKNANCCMFGNQNTWSTKPKMSTALYNILCVMKYYLL